MIRATSRENSTDTATTASSSGPRLTVRLAAAYEDPGLLRDHLEDLGGAAERAALLAEPDLPVATQGMSLTVRDYLHAYVLEWTLHHLDLLAHLGPDALDVGVPAVVFSQELRDRGGVHPAGLPHFDDRHAERVHDDRLAG